MSIKDLSEQLDRATLDLSGNINSLPDLLKAYLKSPVVLQEQKADPIKAESPTVKLLREANERVAVANDLFDKLFKVLDL